MKILYLDGYKVPNSEHSDIEGSITIRRVASDGAVAVSYASDISFYGHAADIIQNKLISNGYDPDSFIDVKIYEDCCGNLLVFQGKITQATIEFCENIGFEADCSIKASILENSIEADAIRCLKSKLVNNNTPDATPAMPNGLPNDNSFWRRKHPIIPYCDVPEPPALRELMLIFTAIFNIIIILNIIVLSPILAIMTAIVAIANAFGANIDTNPFQTGTQSDFFTPLIDFMGAMNQMVIGCVNAHIAPYVRDYVQNGCDQCGLTFQSSILTDPSSVYFNTADLSAPVWEGLFYFVYQNGFANISADVAYKVGAYRTYRDNSNTSNVARYLDDLAKVFNAKWWVQGTTVRFEVANDSPVVWKDLTTDLSGNTSVCYQFTDEVPPAYGRFEYRQDFIDIASNYAYDRYNEIVDFNPTNSPSRSGEGDYTNRFGMAIFRSDGLSDDLLDKYAGFFDPLSSNIISRSNNWLRMSNGRCSQSKLIVLDGNLAESKAINIQLTASSSALAKALGWDAEYLYNYPMYFRDPSEITQAATGNAVILPYLLNLWVDKLDPLNSQRINMRATVEFPYTCEDLVNLNPNATLTIPFNGSPVTMYIENITINESTITVTGIV